MNTTRNRSALSPSASQWEAAFDEARDLDKYQLNWDGEGADPVSLSLIQVTIRLLSVLQQQEFPAPACVYPIADGTAMVEWHYPHGAVDSANIRSSNKIEIVRREPGATPTFSVLSLSDFIASEDTGETSPGSASPYVSDGFDFSLAA